MMPGDQANRCLLGAKWRLEERLPMPKASKEAERLRSVRMFRFDETVVRQSSIITNSSLGRNVDSQADWDGRDSERY